MTLARSITFIVMMIVSSQLSARDYVIYSVMHELPMGTENEKPKKNFYVNIGEKQGLKPGTILDVFRMVVQNDPYVSKKRYEYSIKIGELEVIHRDQDAAIAIALSVEEGAQTPLFDIPNFMIGDEVKVHLD